MKAQTYLHIPKPCHEDWDKMTPNQQGRHCKSCCKTVVDFEMMTDQQVLNFFATAKDETCGRFSHDQLNRALEETKVEKKKGWQWFVATMASFFFFSSRSNAQGAVIITKSNTAEKAKFEEARKAKEKELQQRRLMGKPMVQPRNVVRTSIKGEVAPRMVEVVEPPVEQSCALPVVQIEEKPVAVSPKTPQLIGSVTDEKGSPIAYTTVSLRTINGPMNFSTNEAGEFFVNNPLKVGEEVELNFSSMGYEDKSVPLTFDESKLELHVQLKEKAKQINEVMVTASYGVIGRKSYGGAISVCKVEKIKKADTVMTIKKALGLEAFKIFPNPASKGKAVNLTINEIGDYSVQLFDNNSRLISVQNFSVSAKKEIKLFNIPAAIQSGVYYIRLVNEKNHKQYTDKLFVQ